VKRLWLLLAGLVPALPAAADPPHFGEARPFEFTVLIGRERTVFESDIRSSPTTVRRVGISWREQFGPRVAIGLFGGYTSVTQTGNPLTAGLKLDGYHAGISLHLALLQTERVRLFIAGDYAYQDVDRTGGEQSVALEWYELRARLGAAVALAPRVQIYGGGSYGHIDGQERVTGAVNGTTDFERRARYGGFLGLNFNVEPGGYVGVEAWSGLGRGGKIYFEKRL
jgi:hypothetical protein